jgi:hypothetical protein
MSLLIVIVLASLLSGAHAAGAHGSYSCVGPWLNAQTSLGQQERGKKKDAHPSQRTARPHDDPLAAQRRATAVSLLTTLADKARSFRDGTLRARTQARAADALWELDAELARTLFRRAWADADAADREIERKREEDRKAQLASGVVAMQSAAPELRAEVLRLAGRRDRALGEEFIALLAQPDEKDSAQAGAGDLSYGISPAELQRLGLALKLLEEGDTERAVQFAEPALGRASIPSLKFLSALREKDAPTADRLFTTLVARAAADPDSDANTVSLLVSYVFTPFKYFTSYKTSGTGMSSGKDTPAQDVAPALRNSLVRAAAQILLRPTTPQEYDNTSAGRTGSYIIIKRLLPLFEQHAPDLTAALNARAASLLPDVPERLRTAEAEGGFSLTPKPAPRDPVQTALERAERTTGTAERDEIYAVAALNATFRNDPRAPEIVDKIVDADLLRRVRSFTDFAFVQNALNKKDAEAAVARARKADLTPLQRAWTLERAADLLAKTDRSGAVVLLDEALAEARRISDDDAARAQALLAVATRYEKVDRARAWELMNEVVKAANSAPAFTGEDGEMTVRFKSKRGGWMTSFDVEEFNLSGVLSALAAEDMNRAVQLTDGISNEAARTSAVLAVARSVLVKKS